MAIYSLQVKPASRGAGQNAVAMAAYRSGCRLFDQRTQEFKDYSQKTGITHTAIFYPQGVDFTRQELWNMAETAEKRKDSRIAREILLALPHELPPQARQELAESFAQELVNKYQIAVDLSLHNPDKQGDKRNFHAHLLLTTRQITEHGLTDKADLEREDKFLRQHGKKNGREQIEELRQDWENCCNIALERQGREERISAKSYARRKLLRVPTIHIGKAATSLERKGIETKKGNLNRAIRHHNRLLHHRWKRWRINQEIQKLNREIKELELAILPQEQKKAIELHQSIQRQELEKTISRPEPARQQQTLETAMEPQITKGQPKKSEIVRLLENAKPKEHELDRKQDQKLSINDLLQRSHKNRLEEIDRKYDGIER